MTIPAAARAVTGDVPLVPGSVLEFLVAQARQQAGRLTNALHVVRRAGIEIDRLSHDARVDGSPLSVTANEYRILECLVLAEGVATREEIQAAVWRDGERHSNVLNVHLANLRRKLLVAAGRPLIRTMRGRGFALEAAPPGRARGKQLAGGN